MKNEVLLVMFVLLGSSDKKKEVGGKPWFNGHLILTLLNIINGCGIASLGNFYGKKNKFISLMFQVEST